MGNEEAKKAEELLSKVKEPEKQFEEEKISKEAQKRLEQLKSKVESFKKSILKKFPFISAIGIIHPQAIKLFEEEEEMKKEEKEKMMHLVMIVPNDKAKDFGKVKIEAIKLVQSIKPKIWLHIYVLDEIWEMAADGKYDMVEAIAMAMPLHDKKSLLGALRVASIHKTLCLRKFEKYIVSYVIGGSSVRGDTVNTSDFDVYIVIDDTDVKRMTRTELRDRLRGIIYGYVMEATEIAGVQGKINLHPQIYILTEFWDGIREATPVIFTFVRDGIPLYDRGIFTPWKALLKMGKITGTPEAIEKFLSIGEKTGEVIKRKLLEIATEDIYWSVLMPSQGALMLYGLAPPTHKETVQLMREVLYEKEKLIEKKYVDFLEHVVMDIYKGYEHGKLKEISGKEIDELVKNTKEYIDRLKKVVEEVGDRAAKQTISKLYEDIMGMLAGLFGSASESQIIEKFEAELIGKGRMPSSYLNILKEIVKAKKNLSKMSRQEAEHIRKDAQVLIASLIEYSQRKKLSEIAKLRFSAKINDREGEIYIVGKNIFAVRDLKTPVLEKIDLEKGSITKVNPSELEEALAQPKIETKLTKAMIEKLERILGKIELSL